MTNRLADAASPYLRQHADNPVDWYPWGKEAFERARREDKPVLLSVGYSACHWCHVMAHESFEDDATAARMNELFVNVKVDREERPDVDHIYMSAVQAMTGRGGWPMTVFLTPDAKPFFAGTYFPPEDRHGLPSFGRILEAVAEAWRQRRHEVVGQAERLTAAVSQQVPPAADLPGPEILGAAYRALAASFDPAAGGFGGAPKFPQAPTLEFLLRAAGENWAPRAEDMLTVTLAAMANGGIYDQLGGGFSRYAVDAVWLVPHFEKMLYDNALLARLYLRAWQLTGRPDFRRVAVETLEYVLADLALPGGGLAAAEDADSEGEEGRFYVWEEEEFRRAAGDGAELAAQVYGVTAGGNFEGRTVLHRAVPLETAAASLGLDPGEAAALLARTRSRLAEFRSSRVRPGRDDKVVCGWNGLALRALAEAGAVLAEPRYLQAATANAAFVLAELRRPDGRLLRTWREGTPGVGAFLEDYGAYAVGLYTLYQAVGEVGWWEAAEELVDAAVDLFHEDGRFHTTGRDAEPLITRPADLMDNPAPSGNSLIAEALLWSAHYTGREDRFARFADAVRAGGRLLTDYPAAAGHLLAVRHTSLAPPKEVAIVGPAPAELAAVVWERYRPEVLLAVAEEGDGVVPLMAGRTPAGGGARAYVCQRFACRNPVTRSEELRAQLDA